MPWKLKCPGHQREWYHWTAMVLTWLTLLWHYWHWKPIVVVMPTLLSLEASEDVIITTNNAISDDRVGIMTTIGFKCNSQFHISYSGSLEHRHIDFQTTHNAHTPPARPRGRVSVVSSTGDLLPLMMWTIAQYIWLRYNGSRRCTCFSTQIYDSNWKHVPTGWRVEMQT